MVTKVFLNTEKDLVATVCVADKKAYVHWNFTTSQEVVDEHKLTMKGYREDSEFMISEISRWCDKKGYTLWSY